MANEIERLRQLAVDTGITNRLIQCFELIAAQENASSQHVVEAASFLIANAFSRCPDPMAAWKHCAERIEKAIKQGV